MHIPANSKNIKNSLSSLVVPEKSPYPTVVAVTVTK